MKGKYIIWGMIFGLVFFAFAKMTTAQNSSVSTEEIKVKQLVERFFEGFHKQDSTIIKSVVHEKILMQSIGKNQTGEIVLSKQDFSGFLASICSIPGDTKFEERIKSYKVQIDDNGAMANVWTPYSFYVNGELSHCGTNSFQLFKRDGVWKIFYIVDTRDREGCVMKRG
ncbi:nuclear transport factor 2 family protein [uncultured Dokdonia sp.]|uniref:nuclear transport factor 2 family protein n=1 Tax=uncultured Dokdonia sp. TaxID=575653 RepID=UPI0026350C7E|nr:nuclear transport factor 2 family protein [uncultured Dokdonia sp.]